MVIHGITLPFTKEIERELIAEFKKLWEVERRQFIHKQEKPLAKTRKRLAELHDIVELSKKLEYGENYTIKDGDLTPAGIEVLKAWKE